MDLRLQLLNENKDFQKPGLLINFACTTFLAFMNAWNTSTFISLIKMLFQFMYKWCDKVIASPKCWSVVIPASCMKLVHLLPILFLFWLVNLNKWIVPCLNEIYYHTDQSLSVYEFIKGRKILVRDIHRLHVGESHWV